MWIHSIYSNTKHWVHAANKHLMHNTLAPIGLIYLYTLTHAAAAAAALSLYILTRVINLMSNTDELIRLHWDTTLRYGVQI